MYSYFHPALITIIKDITAETFHPIIFLVSPMPGPIESQPTDSNRYRSKMHHTGGFKTLQEAIDGIPALAEQVKEHLTVGIECKYFKNLRMLAWDGVGIPADTLFISNDELVDSCEYKAE